MIKIVILLTICSYAFSLNCYDCGPDDKGCDDPEKNNLKITNCDDDGAVKQSVIRKLAGPLAQGESRACFTMDFEADQGSALKTGLYKGCGSIKDSCKYELEVGTQGKIKSCQKCTVDRCNGKSGAASLTVSGLTIAILSIYQMLK